MELAPLLREMKMLITDKVWMTIRAKFTVAERERLTNAICGQTICPPGIAIDLTKLSEDLKIKVKAARTITARALGLSRGLETKRWAHYSSDHRLPRTAPASC